MQVVSRQPSEAAPPRIQPLSVLPVFLDLTGKHVVVAGGTDSAAWKAELLVAAGACVEVYAPEVQFSGEMRRLVARERSICHRNQVWDASCLAGAAVALADAADNFEAAAFEAAARNAGAACNVIDKPAFCHFQFGSIVNRSPVVIGISTSGAAPILGQAIRRRIEALLPSSLAQWAALARDLRERVGKTLTPGPRRRAFWEKLVDRAFGPAPTAAAERELRETMSAVAGLQYGRVTFINAGSGDAELLTLKAVRALQAADVIMFDDLVSDEVLELARREAKRILVCKRAGRPGYNQHEISDMLVSLAKAGRSVVRLKSGYPMIFGATDEEVDVLASEGIGCDAVPGIAGDLVMAATRGASLTYRGRIKPIHWARHSN